MKYLLDSNCWIAILRNMSPPLLSRLDQCPAGDVALCSVVLGELLYGAARSGPANRAANEVLVEELCGRYLSLPFDDSAAKHYAQIRADLTAAGRLIGPNDLMIAAIALSNQITLVTRNTGEFSRVDGLPIENWQSS